LGSFRRAFRSGAVDGSPAFAQDFLRMQGFERREHSISADLARLKEARDFAERAAEDFGFDTTGCYQLKLAMSEAVTNAIQHGSSSEDDPIDLRVEAEGEALAFYVKDTGRFVERPFAGGDSLPERGRGLEFMRRLMDDVDLRPSEDGTLLRFAKRPEA
jgi:anti-sigma regulatory factor (Ser/Thr protein kinase)